MLQMFRKVFADYHSAKSTPVALDSFSYRPVVKGYGTFTAETRVRFPVWEAYQIVRVRSKEPHSKRGVQPHSQVQILHLVLPLGLIVLTVAHDLRKVEVAVRFRVGPLFSFFFFVNAFCWLDSILQFCSGAQCRGLISALWLWESWIHTSCKTRTPSPRVHMYSYRYQIKYRQSLTTPE